MSGLTDSPQRRNANAVVEKFCWRQSQKVTKSCTEVIMKKRTLEDIDYIVELLIEIRDTLNNVELLLMDEDGDD